jgi:hypothetical protein
MGGHIGGRMFGRGMRSRGMSGRGLRESGRRFRRMRHRREAFRQCLSAGAACASQENGYGFVSTCGFWDWRCRLGIGSDASSSSLLNLRPFDDSAPDTTEAVARAFSRKSADSVTILDLKSGYSVGITQYSVEGDSLHYVTTYGAQDSIALNRIDLNRTLQDNSSQSTIQVLSSR